jgi:glycosyltransferase involved in cell wall biosynthesis
MGKVSDEELRNLYLKADIYVSMSEHEGFGIPLLEAMSYRIPVLAYNAAAIKDTMGGSGILVNTKDPETVARVCEVIISNEQIREEITEKQMQNLRRYSANSIKERIEGLITKWRGLR